MTRVNKGVELVNDDGLAVGEEQLITCTSMLHAVECADGAVKPSLQLGRLNLVVLPRPQSPEPQRYFVLEGFESVGNDLLDQLTGWN